ncbi:MAG: S1 RNA-binding domain-containing protein [Candidatus Merdivicinus sp.]
MQLEVGKIYEGKVTGITKFGAFVDLGENQTGMVHISEVAPTFVKEITDFISMGQTVKVRVLNIGEEGKVSLSIKRAVDTPPNTQSRPQRPRNNNGSNMDRRPPQNDGNSGFSRGSQQEGSKSFEDMLSKFMQRSDEKMSDLKKSMDSKRGSYQKRPR